MNGLNESEMKALVLLSDTGRIMTLIDLHGREGVPYASLYRMALDGLISAVNMRDSEAVTSAHIGMAVSREILRDVVGVKIAEAGHKKSMTPTLRVLRNCSLLPHGIGLATLRGVADVGSDVLWKAEDNRLIEFMNKACEPVNARETPAREVWVKLTSGGRRWMPSGGLNQWH